MLRSHQSPEPVRLADQSVSIFTLDQTGEPTSSKYTELEELMSSMEFYDPVFLNDLSPKDPYQRRHWMDNQFPIMVYRFAYGSSLGTLSFAWKIPSEVDQTKISRTVAKLTADQKFYATRVMRSDFVNKYYRINKLTKAVLRNMFRTLMEDNSASNCAAEENVDDNALLDIGDPGIILEESAAVDERRHSDILHMPIAASIRHLRVVMIK
jgi:hypothetical protein